MAAITSEGFIDWLERAGVIPNQTRRVVIDAEAGGVVVIFVEMYGSNKMIEVDPPPELRGATIHIVGREEDDQTTPAQVP